MFFVPIDSQYINYFDFRTLSCLFLYVGGGMRVQKISAFSDGFADVIVRRFKTVRGAVAALVFVTYFGSMIMANDMALITFCRLVIWYSNPAPKEGILRLFCYAKCCRQSRRYADSVWKSAKYLSLLLFFFRAGFFKVMAAPFAVAFVLIFLSCLFCQAD